MNSKFNTIHTSTLNSSDAAPDSPRSVGENRFSPPSLIKTPSRLRKSDPDLYKIWCELYRLYFPQREDLANYQVTWANSKRKRTLASCNLRHLRVTVASELRHEKHSQWLSPLLYHEMCHAVLHFEVGRNARGMRWHGSEFKQLEARHPQIEALNHWAKNGGWLGAIRSDRARRSHQKRRTNEVRQRLMPSAKAQLSSKSIDQPSPVAQIIIARRRKSKPPAQIPSGQFLLFLRGLKRKLIGQ